jgi:hypothetical protein
MDQEITQGGFSMAEEWQDWEGVVGDFCTRLGKGFAVYTRL